MPHADTCVTPDLKAQPLIRQAIDLGASRAALIPAKRILLDESLAKVCAESPCPAFGLAMSCPPHSGGPEAFRRYMDNCPQALLLSIEVPSSILLSSAKTEAFAALHHISSALEHTAREKGLKNSRAFAGGSCKAIFCSKEKDCAVLAGRGPCPHKDQARPSLSGFGVDVSHLFKEAGWKMNWAAGKGKTSGDETAPLVGLVLLG